LPGAGDATIRLQPAAKLTNETVTAFLRQLVAEVPWGHNLVILNKLTDPAARLHYLPATAQFG
jgi:predicted nuclease of restriction endonuclease-like (RecB) superfamily